MNMNTQRQRNQAFMPTSCKGGGGVHTQRQGDQAEVGLEAAAPGCACLRKVAYPHTH